MGWLNAERMFDPHRAIFWLPAMTSRGRRLMERLNDQPEDLEALCRDAIEEARPELANCSIYWLNFRPDSLRFEIGVEHPSLPATAIGECAPSMALFEEAGRQDPYQPLT
jgi:hypothetical protein